MSSTFFIEFSSRDTSPNSEDGGQKVIDIIMQAYESSGDKMPVESLDLCDIFLFVEPGFSLLDDEGVLLRGVVEL